MPVWNLPPFREKNAPFPPPADFGRWQLADGTLSKLAASLKVDADSFVDPHEPVRAIPDPWAQARSFAEALISGDVAHPLYASAVSQWRGLLALFGLSERYRKAYTLTHRSIALDSGSLFDRVLTHLTPQIAIGDDHSLWEKPLLIFINDRPVAMGNPACLVSPGRLTPDLAIEHIPWYSSGLRDPLKCGLAVTDLFVLSNWLDGLRRNLEKIPGATADRIRQLLLDYRNECDQLAGKVPFVAEHKVSRYNELGVPYAHLFATTDFNFTGDPATTSATRLLLKRDPEQGQPIGLGELKGLILVDKALTLDPRFDPRSTLVWGTHDLASLLNAPQLLEEVKIKAADAGWMIVTGDDLFTPRLARFPNGAKIVGNPTGMEDMLLPLRPLAMLLDGDLGTMVSANAGPGKAIVTVKLRLDDGSPTGKMFEFSRQFSTDPTDGEGLLVEDEDWRIYHSAIWPNFRSAAWTNYFARFTFAANRMGYMVRPTRALSTDLIAKELAAETAGFAAIDRLHELNGGEGPGYHFQHRGGGGWSRSERKSIGEYEDVQFSTAPFEAISYVDAYGERASAPAGMALLQLPSIEPSTGAGDFDIAVDFGTTNTVACFQNGKPISFQDRLVYPLAYANANESRQALQDAKWLGRWFFPPEIRLTPTPTVALTRVAYPSQEKHHVFRNVVYFHSHEKHARNAEADELSKFSRVASQAKFNLKWSEDAEHVEAASDFLSQFVMMAAAEALATEKRNPRRLRWRFSAPDSMDGELRDKLEDSLREMTRPYSTELAGKDRRTGLEPEGLVAAQFILNDAGFIKGSVNIVLDIGGGTTDVTMWDRDSLLWIGSFKLAGQDFFTRTISQNPGILSQIGLDHWEALFNDPDATIEGVESSDIPHLAEMLFSGPALSNAIDEHWDKRLQYSAGADLRLVAQTFLGGIAWYMGRIAGRLVTDGLRPAALDNPAFALCGRGAGIFKKIHGGRDPEAKSDVTRTLQLFSIAAQTAPDRRPQLFTTQDPKLEVVRGMIKSDGTMRDEVEKAARFYVSGLGVNLAGETGFGPEDKVTRRDLTAAPEAIDLTDFREFIAALREHAGIVIDLREGERQGALQAIDEEVSSFLSKLLNDKDPKKELPPPFILALAVLIGMMASPAATRSRRLTMEFAK